MFSKQFWLFFFYIVGMLTYFKWLHIIGCKYMTVSNAGKRITCIMMSWQDNVVITCLILWKVLWSVFTGTKWSVLPTLDWKFTPKLKASVTLRFLFLFHNKTLNVPHDTTFCMENNAKTLIIHGYKFVITWHNSNGHTCNGIYRERYIRK